MAVKMGLPFARSNVGEREANLARGDSALPGAGVRVTRMSALYETEPVELFGAGVVFELRSGRGNRKDGGGIAALAAEIERGWGARSWWRKGRG